MIGILTALLSGALMSVQGVFNTQVTKATSLWVSTSFCAVYGTSGLSCDLVFCGWEKFYDAYTGPG